MGHGKHLDTATSAPAPAGGPRRALLTFASGGWVIALSLLVMLAVAIRLVLPALQKSNTLRGEGKHLETYGFELAPCLIPQEQITPGVAKDLIKALVTPPTLPGAQLDAYNQEQRERYHRKFVVSTDRVAGVVLGGEARAYPLNVLCWHEACNDVLGGVPLCVSFSPLCDSVVVFERRIAGAELEFGVSGLLYNSNLLLYDRRAAGQGESLWSQLGLRAVAGPAAQLGASLVLLPVEVTNWSDWLARYPQTSIILGEAEYAARYNMNPYGAYLQEGKLKYPVTPAPDPGGPDPFSRVLAVQTTNGWQVYPYPEIAARAISGGVWNTGELSLHYFPESKSMDPPLAYVTANAAGRPAPATLICLWFAWQALYPGAMPALDAQ